MGEFVQKYIKLIFTLMNTIVFYIYRFLSKFLGNSIIIKYYRKLGMSIGENTHIFSKLVSSEPFLISIGDNVTISVGVTLLTHDASIGPIAGRNVFSDIVGSISIGNNCFIGANTIILPGVSIPDNSIVAAGSVVTKTITFPANMINETLSTNEGIIIGGNPAKYICKTSDFVNKRYPNFLKLHGLSIENRKNVILQNKDKWINK